MGDRLGIRGAVYTFVSARNLLQLYKTWTRSNSHVPSIAQLVERWTVVGSRTEIHRSLVQIRLEGDPFCLIPHQQFIFRNLHGFADFLLTLLNVVTALCLIPHQREQLFFRNLHGLVDFLLTWLNVVTALSDVYGHTMLKTPVLVRSLKLSNLKNH